MCFGKKGPAWLAGLALSSGRAGGGRSVAGGGWVQMDEAIATQTRELERMAKRRCPGQVVADRAGESDPFGDGDLGEVGEIERFQDQAGAGQLCRADALGARVGQGKAERGGIGHHGPEMLRWILLQVAQVRPDVRPPHAPGSHG